MKEVLIKYKKIVGLWFFILTIIPIIAFFSINLFNHKNNNKVKKTISSKYVNKCDLNVMYFNQVEKNLLTANKNIKWDFNNNINNKNILFCILDNKNKWILLTMKSKVNNYIDIIEKKEKLDNKFNKITFKFNKINYNYIINNLKVITLWNNSSNIDIKYFKKNDHVNKIDINLKYLIKNNYLKNVKKVKVEKIKWLLNTIRYKKITKQYWKDILITNSKFYIKWLTNIDFDIIKKIENNKKNINFINSIQYLDKIYSNAIVFNNKYIILTNLEQLIEKK